MSKFSQFAVNKRAFNNINGNRCPLFSQINFDQAHSGGYCPGVLSWGFISGDLCLGGIFSGGFMSQNDIKYEGRLIVLKVFFHLIPF